MVSSSGGRWRQSGAVIGFVICTELHLLGCALQPSSGCTGRKGTQSLVAINTGVLDFKWVHVTITEADNSTIKRRFLLTLPHVVHSDKAVPAPLLLSAHGQTSNASQQMKKHAFDRLSKKHGFVVAYIQGLDDYTGDPSDDQGTGWNVGTGGDNSTCVPSLMSTSGCYDSCVRFKQCGPCNWSTCHDDRKFIRKVLRVVEETFCIDTERVYFQGESNGGMLAHYVAQEMPNTFAAVVTWYGLPLLGYQNGARMQLIREATSMRRTAMFQLHARQDVVIPPKGGISNGGWLYESLDDTQGVWAAVHGCDEDLQPVSTPWDGGERAIACFEYKRCSSGRRVMRCFYDGAHGDYPSEDRGDELTVWFMLQFRLPPADMASVVLV